MRTDRELLELAAKAAGYVIRWYEDSLAYGPTFGIEVEPGNPCGFEPWNPLTDDGDALRLAVKVGLLIIVERRQEVSIVKWYADGQVAEYWHWNGSQGADSATRRAIVRAAAEIGRAMP